MSDRVTVHIERYGYVHIPRLAQELISSPSTLSLYFAIRMFSSVRPWKGQRYLLTWAGRDVLMATARLESPTTYSKCMRELKSLGLVEAVTPQPSKKELQEAGFLGENENASGFAPNLLIVRSHVHVNLREHSLPGFMVETLLEEVDGDTEVGVHVDRFGYAKVSKVVQAINSLSKSAFSLYVAINQFAAEKVWEGVVRRLAFPKRDILMALAHIGKSTYQQCMRQLQELGVIKTSEKQPSKAQLVAAGLMPPSEHSARNSFASQLLFVPETIEVTLDESFLSPSMVRLIERDIQKHGITQLVAKPIAKEERESTDARFDETHVAQNLRGTKIDTHEVISQSGKENRYHASQIMRDAENDTHEVATDIGVRTTIHETQSLRDTKTGTHNALKGDLVTDRKQAAQYLRGSKSVPHEVWETHSMDHTDHVSQKASHAKNDDGQAGLSTFLQPDVTSTGSCVAREVRHTDAATRESLPPINTRGASIQEMDLHNPSRLPGLAEVSQQPEAAHRQENHVTVSSQELRSMMSFFEYFLGFLYQRSMTPNDRKAIESLLYIYGYAAVSDAVETLVQQVRRRAERNDLPPIRDPIGYVAEILRSRYARSVKG